MSKHIEFVDAGTTASGKTRLWSVKPKDGGQAIGKVGWYAPWRKYCFEPAMQTIFEWECLRDIAQFCADATAEHRTS